MPSFVRRSLGVEIHDLGFAFDWLVVDVKTPAAARMESPELAAVRPSPPHEHRALRPKASAVGIHAAAWGDARRDEAR